jgi:hypothetical protein
MAPGRKRRQARGAERGRRSVIKRTAWAPWRMWLVEVTM